MEINHDVSVTCPKCSSTDVEKIEDDYSGFFGFYLRGKLDKEYKCKECNHSW